MPVLLAALSKTRKLLTQILHMHIPGHNGLTQPCFIMSKALGEILESILRAHYIPECLSLTSRDLRVVTYIHDNICLVFYSGLDP